MVLFAILSAVVVTLTGLVCYRQGRYDAFEDSSPFTLVGAHLLERLADLPEGDSMTIHFDRRDGGQITGSIIIDQPASSEAGHA